MKKKRLVLSAIFAKASTIIDGSWNITFNVNDIDADKVIDVSKLKDCLLKLTIDIAGAKDFEAESEE
jgi:hypothetical protein